MQFRRQLVHCASFKRLAGKARPVLSQGKLATIKDSLSSLVLRNYQGQELTFNLEPCWWKNAKLYILAY
jgi:hypothetical protein